jgi:cyclic beta-1,2-glucan synthetase
MPRVQGHFFNWYSLEICVLDPPYVSTVDSGNLAGHLVALAEGCTGIAGAPVDDGRIWAAIEAEGVSARESGGAWWVSASWRTSRRSSSCADARR